MGTGEFDTDNPIRYLSRARLMDLLGEEAARRLVGAMGGRYLRVPAAGTPAFDELVRTLNDAQAGRRFAKALAGERVALPRRLRSMGDEVGPLAARGLGANEIAERLGCSVQHVWRRLARAGKSARRNPSASAAPSARAAHTRPTRRGQR